MITKFQQHVYDALRLIPPGRVTTYKFLGDFIGCRSPQAIGQALTRNPNHPRIPCHRVICSDGSIGGYVLGVEQKRGILLKEGVKFTKKRGKYILADKTQLWSFENRIQG